MAEQTIVCPKCGNRFPVSKALTDQIEAEAEKRGKEAEAVYEKKLATETARLEKQERQKAEQAVAAELSKIQRELAQAQKREKEVESAFNKKLAAETERLQKEARKQAEKAVSAELSKTQRELAQARKRGDDAQASFERRLGEEKSKLEKQARKTEVETTERLEAEHHNHELELEKKLSDAKQQAAELKRKLELGSQQAQGEVIELELANALKSTFPDDKIKPVAKGKPGADVLQKVYASGGQYCGTIIWESKNTQNWSKAWLGKLRSDQRRENAELAVLVSMALPKDVRHFAQVEGVWVTQLPLALGLATVLRTNLIQVAELKQPLTGKHEKMELLYEYLSSTEFRHRIEAFVEAFRTMEDDLKKERQTMERQWAKREKQIRSVYQSVSGMYGDMQRIADQSLPKIRRLELPAWAG